MKSFLSILIVLSVPVLSGAEQRNDVLGVLKYLTDVKHQGSRNTCTIFSTTAMLETFYLQKNGVEVDFSEQWMQYLSSLISESGGVNGSYVSRNFTQLKRHGLSIESVMPYSGTIWSVKDTPKKVDKFCANLNGPKLTRCLTSHTNPDYYSLSDRELEELPGGQSFMIARAYAQKFKNNLTKNLSGGVVKASSVKRLLDKKITPTLEIDIYYGSWNTPHADSYKIDKQSSLYDRGIVSYPERGSIDRQVSPQHRARHSVQIIGYDDEVEVEYKRKMLDGSTQTFKRTGVYYFKNSWGTKGFGRNFKLSVDGKSYSLPGYGMIVQDHANEFGTFFSIDERHYN